MKWKRSLLSILFYLYRSSYSKTNSLISRLIALANCENQFRNLRRLRGTDSYLISLARAHLFALRSLREMAVWRIGIWDFVTRYHIPGSSPTRISAWRHAQRSADRPGPKNMKRLLSGPGKTKTFAIGWWTAWPAQVTGFNFCSFNTSALQPPTQPRLAPRTYDNINHSVTIIVRDCHQIFSRHRHHNSTCHWTTSRGTRSHNFNSSTCVLFRSSTTVPVPTSSHLSILEDSSSAQAARMPRNLVFQDIPH